MYIFPNFVGVLMLLLVKLCSFYLSIRTICMTSVILNFLYWRKLFAWQCVFLILFTKCMFGVMGNVIISARNENEVCLYVQSCRVLF